MGVKTQQVRAFRDKARWGVGPSGVLWIPSLSVPYRPDTLSGLLWMA
jgi:hypothetical protein